MASLPSAPVEPSSATDSPNSKTPRVEISGTSTSSETNENVATEWWSLKGRSKEQKLLLKLDFYVGAMALLGNWYTPVELGKRASIFYSASFAANMFSGYLQAAVHKGLDGAHGLAGWRWLFIMCGIITVPGALWEFFAMPDSPYKTKVWYLKEGDIELAKSRMVKLDRRPFKGIGVATFE
jgi:hypothetical protein